MTTRKVLATRIRRLLAKENGSAVIEFAILAPPLVLFLFGMIEFSRYAYTQSALNFAAEEATRFAVVNGGNVTNDEVLDLARDNLLFLDSGLAALCILPSTTAQGTRLPRLIRRQHRESHTARRQGTHRCCIDRGFR